MSVRLVRALALVAVVALIGSSCSNGDTEVTASRSDSAADVSESSADPTDPTDPTEDGNVDTDPLTPFDGSIVPPAIAVPATTIVAGGDPIARAQELVDALRAENADVAALWTTVYAELGIPVVGVDGFAADDPIGPGWDHVWSMAGLSKGSLTVPSSDLERLFAAAASPDSATSTSPMPAGTLLSDIREAAAATDPRSVFLGEFVARLSVAYGFADPRDATATPESFRLDPATMLLLGWVALRKVALDVGAASTVEGFVGERTPRRRTTPTLCTAPTDSEAWVLAIEKAVGGGVEIGGVGSLPGVSTFITNAIGFTGNIAAAERAAKVFGAAGVATAAVSAVAMISSMSASGTMSPSPLERNRERRQGKDATVTVTISFDTGATGTAAEVACAANVVGRAVGSEITVPIEGTPISGADVKFDAGKNIPTKVQFNSGSVNLSTGSDGSASIPVTGVARSKDLPESARQVDDTFGVRIAAQVEGPSLQAMLDIFLGGLTISATGALGAAVNVAKTIRWDLGEITFPMKDWEADSYRIDQPFGVLRITGIVCDLNSPFAITVGGEINGSIVLTPSSPDRGQYAGGAPDVFLIWEGTYTVDRSNPDQPVINTTPTKEQIEPPTGPAMAVGEFWAGASVSLIRDESACPR